MVEAIALAMSSSVVAPLGNGSVTGLGSVMSSLGKNSNSVGGGVGGVGGNLVRAHSRAQSRNINDLSTALASGGTPDPMHEVCGSMLRHAGRCSDSHRQGLAMSREKQRQHCLRLCRQHDPRTAKRTRAALTTCRSSGEATSDPMREVRGGVLRQRCCARWSGWPEPAGKRQPGGGGAET